MNERGDSLPFKYHEAETSMEVLAITPLKVVSGADLAPLSISDPTDQRNLS